MLKSSIKHDFYDQYADVQRQSALFLAEFFEGTPSSILDVGAGTGMLLRTLKMKAPLAEWTLLDISQERLSQIPLDSAIRLWPIDAKEIISFPRFDCIVSNLAFHWFRDVAHVIHRLLAATPFLLFTIPLNGTLKEWHDLGQIYGLHWDPFPFLGLEDLQKMIPDGKITERQLTFSYPSVLDFLNTLRYTNTNMIPSRRLPFLRPILRAHHGPITISYRIACVRRS